MDSGCAAIGTCASPIILGNPTIPLGVILHTHEVTQNQGGRMCDRNSLQLHVVHMEVVTVELHRSLDFLQISTGGHGVVSG